MIKNNKLDIGKIYFIPINEICRYTIYNAYKEWNYNKNIVDNINNMFPHKDIFLSPQTVFIGNSNISNCLIAIKYLGNDIFEEVTTGLKIQSNYNDYFDSIINPMRDELYIEYPAYLYNTYSNNEFNIKYMFDYEKNLYNIPVEQYNRLLKEYIEKVNKYPYTFLVRDSFNELNYNMYELNNKNIQKKYLKFPNDIRSKLLESLKDNYTINHEIYDDEMKNIEYYINKNSMWNQYIECQKENVNPYENYEEAVFENELYKVRKY